MLVSCGVPSLLAFTNIIKVFVDCDPVGQVICVMLLLFSIFAWSVMLGKNGELNKLRRLNHNFERRLREERKVLDLPDSFRNMRTIPYADVAADAVEAYWRSASILQERGEDRLQARLEHAENAVARALAHQTLRYEENMVWLATMVSVAPFLGLLGTVWGVMTAFSAVSVLQTASIQTLAPGVSAALLTTICGLVVAIPSVVGYNVLLNKTKLLTTEIENYASSLADRIELEMVK
ncbi:MAG TPA: MotA/TolQ/ExbB proton channel family protein [Candidatus Didemnitutus sp.]|nr:MotA/TolQ/ExbB proton channel family protein [Candidatus Didemnitutus sp.]